MSGNLVTIIVVAASAGLNYLLTQPPGTFPPQVLIFIGLASVVLTAISRFLPTSGTPVQVEVTKPVETTPVEPPPL